MMFLTLILMFLVIQRFINTKMHTHTHRLLLHKIGQLMTVASPSGFISMRAAAQIAPLKGYSLAINSEGIIEKIGTSQEISSWILEQNITFQHSIDCSNKVVLPGLVDAHTHALFAGDRSRQFDMKLNGKTYVDIYNEGLGIRYTTEQINKSEIENLVEHLEKYLRKMSKLGTTTVEVKSGYGLNAEAEVKMLKAIEIARKRVQGIIDVVATFCGAHAIPKGKTEEEQTIDVIQNQIPAVKAAMESGQINPKFIDVFCERKFFQKESSTRIMHAGKAIGLTPSFHGDQLSNLQSGSIAVQVGALAVAHLEYLSLDSIKSMASHGVAAVLLPTTQNIQKLPIPPIKEMREHDMIVALGSDFCPNAYCYNMALVTHLACTNYRLTPKEAISAATINSAYALGVQKSVGSLQVGKKGDLIVMEATEWVSLMYMFGDTPISAVVKEGKVLQG